MKRIGYLVVALGAAFLVSCAPGREGPSHASSSTMAKPAGLIAEGTVTQLSANHGNVYTSIRPDQYESLGLRPGKTIRVAFDKTAMDLVVGKTYEDVPAGTPLAVLHREGLTFAIRDGNFSKTHGISTGDRFQIMAAK